MVVAPPAGNDTDFVDAFGMAVATWGVPRMAGRALAVLLAHPKALDMDAVATRLAASKGSLGPATSIGLARKGDSVRRGARFHRRRAPRDDDRGRRGTVRGGAHLGGEKLAELETVSARLLGPDR